MQAAGFRDGCTLFDGWLQPLKPEATKYSPPVLLEAVEDDIQSRKECLGLGFWGDLDARLSCGKRCDSLAQASSTQIDSFAAFLSVATGPHMFRTMPNTSCNAIPSCIPCA